MKKLLLFKKGLSNMELLSSLQQITQSNMLEKQLELQAEALIPTPWGNFRMLAFAASEAEWMPNLALVHEGYTADSPTLIRLHSECITGDLFGSKLCDCGQQLDYALEKIAAEKGILLYLRQEGRGIGIINKLKAYQLQNKGLNTIDANLHLGLEVDARQYDIAIAMLQDLGVKQVNLLTNNPEKIEALDKSPIKILSRQPIIIPAQTQNAGYLATKQKDMGHLF